jgi:hypothetical protein
MIGLPIPKDIVFLRLEMGCIKFKSLILEKSTSLTLRNTHVIAHDLRNTIHHAHMQLWHANTKQKIHISFLQRSTLCLRIGRRTITSFSLLALRICRLSLGFCHLSLKNSVVGLQQSEFGRVLGSAKRKNVQSAKE